MRTESLNFRWTLSEPIPIGYLVDMVGQSILAFYELSLIRILLGIVFWIQILPTERNRRAVTCLICSLSVLPQEPVFLSTAVVAVLKEN